MGADREPFALSKPLPDGDRSRTTVRPEPVEGRGHRAGPVAGAHLMKDTSDGISRVFSNGWRGAPTTYNTLHTAWHNEAILMSNHVSGVQRPVSPTSYARSQEDAASPSTAARPGVA